MTSLRHLKIKSCTRLPRMPDDIGELINLQSLLIFIVGQTRQADIFSVTKPTESLDVDEHKLNGSVRGPRSQTGYRQSAEDAEELLRTILKPNSRIDKLFLNGYPGTQSLDWMNSFTLCNLIVLEDFPKLRTSGTNPVDRLACVNKLTIINCPVLITMPWFPFLQHVEVRNCPLVMVGFVAQLQSLSTLVIDNFPELLNISKALMENNLLLSSLTISSCPKLQFIACKFWRTPEFEVDKNFVGFRIETLCHMWIRESHFSGDLGDY
ncbi:unnamed protein product [Dovyalis caffra]|uniref:Disease resistance protein n=1 Tax=Dovyalis caffra TaxID=77055 RepID=A0AAV1SJ96_9ROSI|nr:unnamed protein product [Dovyalis caffra]